MSEQTSVPDRTLSKNLKPGTQLRWHGGSIVTLDRRKTPDDERIRRHGIPYRPGWWLRGDPGGLADFVIDDPEMGWELVEEPGAEGSHG